ncbi:Rossmann-like and DUF2520 domain-containing protein [Flavobacterium crassostreae]|uniref:DUF2520 domain-containing protein n=1 Tax=Flavobacterium crassostreae TaxID=1763534 RepID=A0A1B9E2G7_9FLAO|nr:DUF2520 domain-containing protein [Flavobacterium crassostreae]OCB76133.1 hypothetical protein LPBF_07430 [Flavobacterium crassostreae]
MIKVIIIGSGNVAQHLINAFQTTQNSGHPIELVQVYARNKETLLHLVAPNKITTNYSDLQEAHLYILAVSDDALPEVSNALPFSNRLVAHTSGSAPITVLNDRNKRAVFYPLQTFTKNKAITFKTIPICLETENSADFETVKQIASLLSDQAIAINSQQRKALHVAAVFANNFTNHLYQLANAICQEHQVPFGILEPLIQETAQKIQHITPQQAQTGPAKRKDATTIEAHLEFLTDQNQQNIYTLLTQSIQKNGKKL